VSIIGKGWSGKKQGKLSKSYPGPWNQQEHHTNKGKVGPSREEVLEGRDLGNSAGTPFVTLTFEGRLIEQGKGKKLSRLEKVPVEKGGGGKEMQHQSEKKLIAHDKWERDFFDLPRQRGSVRTEKKKRRGSKPGSSGDW